MNRHQFNRCDAERFQIRNFFDHAQVGTRVLRLARGVLREPANMQFIDHRLGCMSLQVSVAGPIEIIIDHDTFRRADDPVCRRLKLARQCLGIRINQASIRIKPHSTSRIKGTTGLKMIKLARADAGYENTPDISPPIGLGIERDNFSRLQVCDAVVQ